MREESLAEDLVVEEFYALKCICLPVALLFDSSRMCQFNKHIIEGSLSLKVFVIVCLCGLHCKLP